MSIGAIYCLRPYNVESTSSRLITEVKPHLARLVLGWVTAWEYLVLQTSFLLRQILNIPRWSPIQVLTWPDVA